GTRLIEHREIADTVVQILGFGIGPDGSMLIVDYVGAVYRLVRKPASEQQAEFPRSLSETGLFASTAEHRPMPGLIPYEVNAALWSDGAHKERFLALPGEVRIEFTDRRGWNFPDGSVLVKTFSLDSPVGDPPVPPHTKGGPGGVAAPRRRIETRVLLKQQGEWAGYSYLWNDEQTDAQLVASAGLDKTYNVADPAAPGRRREQTWHFPSRAECMVCHSRAANYVLGPSTGQMNRSRDYGRLHDNQLRVLAHLGVFAKRPRLRAEAHERLADPFDESQPLEVRARSYLHANCAICHVEAGGGNSRMQMEFSTPLDKTMLIDQPPQHDSFGIADARIIAPGDPERSVLLYRLQHRGRGQMPPLATSHVDEQAVELFRRWIAAMPRETLGN
ncbi:MAG: heme-binding domain-containing protein, partial [Planctomycetes bacterium]|nr:heme-binding domain-containing protein [Planctomycetota bacterium]